jgi:hypothetical protein
MPERHTGEGIFFSSKVADRFVIRSHKIELVVDNKTEELFASQTNQQIGTLVEFYLSRQSKKNLQEIFQKYTNEDFKFDKTKVLVALNEENGMLSRSQARKLLYGLDKFERIQLDFQKVKGIGQGFADEIFRVYAQAHPDKLVEPVNANDVVAFFIKKASQA